MSTSVFPRTVSRPGVGLFLALLAGLSLAFGPAQAQPYDCSTDQTEIPTIQCEALVALYNNTGGATWTNNTGWLDTAVLPCSWNGVACTGGTPRNVRNLFLANNNLDGTIPTELGNLPSLNKLLLHRNNLTGSIPTELGNLTGLTELRVCFNGLTGTIPTELGNLTSMKKLCLGENNLSGTIPDLSALTLLQELKIGQNNLTGTIPTWLGSLPSLQELTFYLNQLTGTIPSELGNLSNLKLLWMGDNLLTGTIPPELGNLASAIELKMEGNQLSGSIPPELGGLSNLQLLWMDNNSLTGGIPLELGALAQLQELTLHGNNLDGALPVELGDLTNLTFFRLDNNASLTGGVPLAVAQLGAGIESGGGTCNFTNTALCIPDEPDYQAIGQDPICGLPLDPSCNVLPVELVAFEAVADGNAVLLTWKTASETNNAGFEVQHEQDVAWEVLAFVEGSGTTLEPQAYTHRIDGLLPGRHRFRLKQIDFDGTLEYSPQVELAVGVPEAFHLSSAYPNPFNPETTFSLSVARSQQVRVAVYDMLGRQVALLHHGTFAEESARVFRFEAGDLPSGLYMIHVAAERFTAGQQIMLVK